MTRARSPLMTFPLVRLAVGLSVGFAGAFGAVWLIDVLGPASPPVAFEAVVGEPDFAAFCSARGFEAHAIGDVSPTWMCTGVVDGFWTTEPIDVDEVCGAQFDRAIASRTRSDVWQCVTLVSGG